VGTFYHPEWIGLEHIDGVPVKGGDCDNDNEDDGGDANETPETFDARYHWFNCTSISHIWNQGNCAADWVYKNLFVYTDIKDIIRTPLT